MYFTALFRVKTVKLFQQAGRASIQVHQMKTCQIAECFTLSSSVWVQNMRWIFSLWWQPVLCAFTHDWTMSLYYYTYSGYKRSTHPFKCQVFVVKNNETRINNFRTLSTFNVTYCISISLKILKMSNLKELIMQNDPLQIHVIALLDYNGWCINMFITLVLQLVKVAIILITLYTSG